MASSTSVAPLSRESSYYTGPQTQSQGAFPGKSKAIGTHMKFEAALEIIGSRSSFPSNMTKTQNPKPPQWRCMALRRRNDNMIQLPRCLLLLATENCVVTKRHEEPAVVLVCLDVRPAPNAMRSSRNDRNGSIT
jgi:hypothetical protein